MPEATSSPARLDALPAAAEVALRAAGLIDEAELHAAVATLASHEGLREELRRDATPSQRTLLDALKVAGVAKVGLRHKGAGVLLAELMPTTADPPAAAAPAGQSLAPGVVLAPPGAGLGDDFWAAVSKASCASTEAVGLPAADERESGGAVKLDLDFASATKDREKLDAALVADLAQSLGVDPGRIKIKAVADGGK